MGGDEVTGVDVAGGGVEVLLPPLPPHAAAESTAAAITSRSRSRLVVRGTERPFIGGTVGVRSGRPGGLHRSSQKRGGPTWGERAHPPTALASRSPDRSSRIASSRRTPADTAVVSVTSPLLSRGLPRKHRGVNGFHSSLAEVVLVVDGPGLLCVGAGRGCSLRRGRPGRLCGRLLLALEVALEVDGALEAAGGVVAAAALLVLANALLVLAALLVVVRALGLGALLDVVGVA